MSYSIERLTDSGQNIEGPHWDTETQTLYYVDLFRNTIHKYKPSTKEQAEAVIEGRPSFIIPIEGATDQFLIGSNRDLIIITWDGTSRAVSSFQKIAEVDTAEKFLNNKLNDGKVDPTGTLWTGTLDDNFKAPWSPPEIGNLYSFNKKRELKCHVSGIRVSNGLAWNYDLKKFYFIDSMKKTVDQFDHDTENEAISNRQSIFSLEKHNIEGLPDGQAIDTDGNLWVAIFNGSSVLKIDPRRPETLLQTVKLPAKQVTSVAFGGKNLDELYVTTARSDILGDNLSEPINGALYRVKGLGVKGFGGVRAKV